MNNMPTFIVSAFETSFRARLLFDVVSPEKLLSSEKTERKNENVIVSIHFSFENHITSL